MYRSTPISSKRTMDDSASFVCSVEKTMWPVMAARTEMDAVSASRVSPTMMTSGSWRSKARRPLSNVRPAMLLTCVWLMRARLRSTGSSIVETLTCRSAIVCRTMYSVVVLPEPVGPVR